MELSGRSTQRLAATLVVALVVGALAAGLALLRADHVPELLKGSPASWKTFTESIDHGWVAPALPATGSSQDREKPARTTRRQSTISASDSVATAPWLRGNALERWNGEMMEAVREDRLNPVRAARAYALLNVSLYDALVEVARSVDPERPGTRVRGARLLVPSDTEHDDREVAAAAGAAERVLTYVFPSRRARFEALADEAVRFDNRAGMGSRGEIHVARDIGRAVGDRVVRRAHDDGSWGWWTGVIPAQANTWRPTAGQTRPLEPLAGTWSTWLLVDGAELRPPPPPPLGSAEFGRDVAELVRTRSELTPEDVDIARFWADGKGTVTPAGHWLIIALDSAREEGLGLAQTARVLAYVAVAQADAFIACWDAKYAFWWPRPVQIIQGFASAIPTPPFPAYPSGHSTQSRAAATVLASIFPARSADFLRLADEAGESRILGGIHWRVDHTSGSRLGAAVGERAVERMRQDIPG